MKKYIEIFIIGIISSSLFLTGCSKKTEAPVITDNKITTVEPNAIEDKKVEVKPEVKPEVKQAPTNKESTTPIPKTNNNSTNKQSKPQTTTAVKSTTAQKPVTQQKQVQYSPTILGNNDTNADFQYLKFFGFNFTWPPLGTLPINNFRVSWDGEGSPNFTLRLVDLSSNQYYDLIFWAYIGNVHSYTIPASLLKVDHTYEVQLEATNGTNYQKQGYESLPPKNTGILGYNIKVVN